MKQFYSERLVLSVEDLRGYLWHNMMGPIWGGESNAELEKSQVLFTESSPILHRICLKRNEGYIPGGITCFAQKSYLASAVNWRSLI